MKATTENGPLPRGDLSIEESRAAGLLTIAQAAEAAGCSAKMLRHYESMELIAAARSDGGYRLYGPEAVRRAQVIVAASACGIPLSSIKVALKAKVGFARLIADRKARLQRLAELVA